MLSLFASSCSPVGEQKTTGQSGKGKLMKRKPLPVLLLTTDGGDNQVRLFLSLSSLFRASF